MAYLGLLEVEHAHNHPVLRVFCQILVDLIPPGCHRHLSQYSQELKGECFYQGNDDSDVRPMSFTNNQLGRRSVYKMHRLSIFYVIISQMSNSYSIKNLILLIYILFYKLRHFIHHTMCVCLQIYYTI